MLDLGVTLFLGGIAWFGMCLTATMMEAAPPNDGLPGLTGVVAAGFGILFVIAHFIGKALGG